MLSTLSGLDPAILGKAFSGQLVAQDPEDEPASIMLQRIRAADDGAAAGARPFGRSRRAAAELDDQMSVGLQLNANFQPLDVTEPASWHAQKKFLAADLFTMSYFVSEVRSLDGTGVVGEFWKTVFSEAKPGALFVYTDNAHEYFTSYFDPIWQSAGLQSVIGCGSERFTPRFSEQASELNLYQQKFGHHPKIQAQLTYRVLRKA